MVNVAAQTEIEPYFQPQRPYHVERDIYTFSLQRETPGMLANRYYFGHPKWGKEYFDACHRDMKFIAAWKAVIETWRDQIVVDIGCGPGNIYASLKPHLGESRCLIGVDVSPGALAMAQTLGYTAVMADAQDLPFESGWADIVMVNATLHHCDDMAQVLKEAARIVKPGGLLITDHDPQRSSLDLKGLGLFLWNFRLPLYRWMKRGGHASEEEQRWGLTSEVHHHPGDGVTVAFFHEILEPFQFEVQVYPHNHTVGADLLKGVHGRPYPRCRWAQRLSGIDPDRPESALSLMCVARRQK